LTEWEYPPFDLFATIIAALTAHFRRFDTLAIDDSSTGMGTTPGLATDFIAQSPIDPLPCAILTPFVVVIVHALIVWEIMWQVFPLTTRLRNIEHGVHRFSHINFYRPSWSLVFQWQ
jgi:hypothetical protein